MAKLLLELAADLALREEGHHFSGLGGFVEADHFFVEFLALGGRDATGSRKFVVFGVLMFVAGLDENVDMLGGVAAGGGAVLFVEESQEVGEGFDFVVLASLVADFLAFVLGVVVFDARDVTAVRMFSPRGQGSCRAGAVGGLFC